MGVGGVSGVVGDGGDLTDPELDEAANMTAIVSALAKQQSEGEEEYNSGGCGGGIHGPGDSMTSSNEGVRHRKTSNSSDDSVR